MKKIFQLYLFLFVFSFSSISYSSDDELELVAESAILIDADTGQILYGKNETQQMYPASTTKIMTLILALEHSNLAENVTVDDSTPFEVIGSHIALEPGEVLTMEQLLDALMLQSANDSAMVIAKHISGSIEDFGKLMTSKASEIGAQNTVFVNPNGLPDERHVTTAYDLAMIGRYGMKHSDFRSFVSKVYDTIPPTNIKAEQRYLTNSNKMLYSEREISVDGNTVPIKYEGITGIKTGYTDDAQHCLIASASRNGTEYISVVLKTDKQNLYVDTHKLLNYGFENFKNEKIASKGESAGSLNWNDYNLSGSIGDDIYCKVPKNLSELDIEKKFSVYPELKMPINAGDAIGKVTYSYGGSVIASSDILSNENFSEEVPESDSIMTYILFGLAFLAVVLTVRIVFVFIRRNQKNKRRKKTRAS